MLSRRQRLVSHTASLNCEHLKEPLLDSHYHLDIYRYRETQPTSATIASSLPKRIQGVRNIGVDLHFRRTAQEISTIVCEKFSAFTKEAVPPHSSAGSSSSQGTRYGIGPGVRWAGFYDTYGSGAFLRRHG